MAVVGALQLSLADLYPINSVFAGDFFKVSLDFAKYKSIEVSVKHQMEGISSLSRALGLGLLFN